MKIETGSLQILKHLLRYGTADSIEVNLVFEVAKIRVFFDMCKFIFATFRDSRDRRKNEKKHHAELRFAAVWRGLV